MRRPKSPHINVVPLVLPPVGMRGLPFGSLNVDLRFGMSQFCGDAVLENGRQVCDLGEVWGCCDALESADVILNEERARVDGAEACRKCEKRHILFEAMLLSIDVCCLF